MNLPCHIVLEKCREEEKEGKRGKSELIGRNEWKERETDRRRCYHIFEPLIANITLPPIRQTRHNAISPNDTISTQTSELEVFGFAWTASETFISLRQHV